MSRSVCPWCQNPYIENSDGVLVCKNIDCVACAEEYLHKEIEHLRRERQQDLETISTLCKETKELSDKNYSLQKKLDLANGELDYIQEQVEKDAVVHEHNNYKWYSGGYIFDQMNKAALNYIKYKEGFPEDTVIVTQAVDELRFERQLCDKYIITVHCFDFAKTKLYTILYNCKAEVLNNKGNPIYENFILRRFDYRCKQKQRRCF